MNCGEILRTLKDSKLSTYKHIKYSFGNEKRIRALVVRIRDGYNIVVGILDIFNSFVRVIVDKSESYRGWG